MCMVVGVTVQFLVRSPPRESEKEALRLPPRRLPPKPIFPRPLPLSLRRAAAAGGMRGISKLAMGSAMVVAVCLFLIFVLLLILYVELCCSFLWQRRRRGQHPPPLPTTAAPGDGGASFTKWQSKSQGDDDVVSVPVPAEGDELQKGERETLVSPLQKPTVSPSAAAYYAHGVLQTPASLFFAGVPRVEGEVLGSRAAASPLTGKSSVHLIGLIPSPCSAPKGGWHFSSRCSPEEQFVCISNPIFDGAFGDKGGILKGDDDGSTGTSTPFETPGTSPSRLEMEEEVEMVELPRNGEESPPLKPMKKLPSVLPLGTPAVLLADGRRSLATSVSATDTYMASSSSSSNSPSTSPSW